MVPIRLHIILMTTKFTKVKMKKTSKKKVMEAGHQNMMIVIRVKILSKHICLRINLTEMSVYLLKDFYNILFF